MKQKTDLLIRQNLIIISNLEYLYGSNASLDELSKDVNFIKAIDCTYNTVNEILNLELDDPFSFDRLLV